MTLEEFLRRCPSLWHVAPPGAWDRIRRTGFRTAEQLLRDAELESPEQRDPEQPRRAAVVLGIGGDEVVLRDQEPLLQRRNLSSILDDGLDTADWVRLLNKRSYLFADRGARDIFLAKYVARDGAQDVIVFSPLRLWLAAATRMELTTQNTGAIARRSGPQKGLQTFVPASRFPDRKPAEVTIVDGLDDLGSVVRAERIYSDGRRLQLAK